MTEPVNWSVRIFRSFWYLVISIMAFAFAYDAFHVLNHPEITSGNHLLLGPVGNRIGGVVFIIGGVVYLVRAISNLFQKEKPSDPQ